MLWRDLTKCARNRLQLVELLAMLESWSSHSEIAHRTWKSLGDLWEKETDGFVFQSYFCFFQFWRRQHWVVFVLTALRRFVNQISRKCWWDKVCVSTKEKGWERLWRKSGGCWTGNWRPELSQHHSLLCFQYHIQDQIEVWRDSTCVWVKNGK